MNYWITTQWPLDINQPREWAVWLPDDGRQEAGRELRAGDRVLVYESRSGRCKLVRQPDGSTRRIPRTTGKTAVIGIIQLTEALVEVPGARCQEYDDGSSIRWGYRARGRLCMSDGLVPRVVVNRTLGYKPAYNFHGFGDRHSGLKKLTLAEYGALEAALLKAGGHPVK
jgi:hypothetical protein